MRRQGRFPAPDISMNDVRLGIRDKLLKLSESQLSKWWKRISVKCENFDDYFAITDLLKEVCQSREFDIEKVLGNN